MVGESAVVYQELEPVMSGAKVLAVFDSKGHIIYHPNRNSDHYQQCQEHRHKPRPSQDILENISKKMKGLCKQSRPLRDTRPY